MGGLDSIAAEAAATDATVAGTAPGAGDTAPGGPGAGPAGADAPSPGAATAALLFGLLTGLVGVAVKRFPSLAAVWTPDAVHTVADALAPLLDKYGLATPEWLERWRLEISALMLCGPLLFATIAAVRADLEAEAAARAKNVSPGAAAAAPL